MDRHSHSTGHTDDPSSDNKNELNSNHTPRPVWLGYIVTILAEILLALTLSAIHPYLPLGRFAAPYMLLVILSAYLFDVGPAILALVVGWGVLRYMFMPPIHSLWPIASNPGGWAITIWYLVASLLAGSASIVVRRSQFKARKRLAERRQAEEDLRQTSQRLSALVQNSPLALIEWNPDYRITRWTDEAEELFGWKSDEVLGKRIDDFQWVYEDDWPIVHQLMADMLAGRRSRNVNPNRNYRKDGSVIYCEWYNSVLMDEHGNMTSVLSLILDVTERQRAQAELQHQVYLLQKALLPAQPPTIEGFTFATCYKPAFAGQDVGGDFYDLLATEAGMLGIMIGDVSGKGIEAAALAATTRSTVGAFIYDFSAPGDALTHANSMIISKQASDYQFVTTFLAVIDPNTGHLTFSSAGHPPAMICRVDGQIELLTCVDLPLGVMKSEVYEQQSADLLPGDKLIMYTDGISEARSDTVLFGAEGIERTLTQHGHESADQLMNSILDATNTWSGGKQRDDVAVLVIERNSTPAVQ